MRGLSRIVSLFLAVGCGSGGGDAVREEPDTPRPEYYAVRIPKGAPTRGPDDAPVTVVVFSDFQSPRGASNARALDRLLARFDGQLRVVYRANPLPRHPDARRAELAARAAALQGAFWPMHDALFADGGLGEADLLKAAHKAGCDVAKLVEDMDDLALSKAIAADRADALALGIFDAPFNFVNGRPLEAIRFVDDAAVVVREELERARRIVKRAAVVGGVYELVIAGGRDRLLGASRPGPPRRDPAARYRVPVGDEVPSLGPPDAAVTIVVFLDLECPFCASTFLALAKLRDRRPDELRIAVMHLPHPSHPNAALAAEAAIEAQAQGRFWEFLPAVLEAGTPPDKAVLIAAAERVGMNTAALEDALERRAHAARVERDRAFAATLELRGTPQLFINGLLRRGSHSFDQLDALVAREIESARAAPLEQGDGGTRTVYERIMERAATAPVFLEPGADDGNAALVSDGTHRIFDVSVPADTPLRGPRTAPVLIVEFGDYQCGACAAMEPFIDDLVARRDGKVAAAFLHYPLLGHEHAALAAQAAVEAARQGRFSEYHALLMSSGGALTRDDLLAYAKTAGLDVDDLRAALEDRRHESTVARDIASARRLGLAGTPAFFVNGRKVTGASQAAIEALVDRLLAKGR